MSDEIDDLLGPDVNEQDSPAKEAADILHAQLHARELYGRIRGHAVITLTHCEGQRIARELERMSNIAEWHHVERYDPRRPRPWATR